ncbi:hypothetical protein K6U06_10915 [Acidiferrimicrobium sp. IK]|uniref:hypothetical protein n=1 Tax=Acidiferrimicrobium sp. IK TaxID=2871700 RepID=UPI0021CB2913|nr:hypothetical protein [Acidiferrimicrobium sp. IK]MCU4184871.1 hypothetical protein [Acidiferrimicrobium sp. IK]
MPVGTRYIVRGGIMDNLERVIRRAQDDYDEFYGREYDLGLALSVHCDVWRAEETWSGFLCRMATDGEVRNAKLRVADLDEVERLGFRVVNTPPPPSHHDVDLGTINPAGELDKLMSAFRPAEENPCRFMN